MEWENDREEEEQQQGRQNKRGCIQVVETSKENDVDEAKAKN
jgi:hypothetical protein